MKIAHSTESSLKHLAAVALGLGLAAGTALAAPANDDFANAIDLTGSGTNQTGSVTSGDQTSTDTVAATLEAGEPNPGATNTVWFKWTSPGDGGFTYGTLGSTNAGATEWDSIIGIYTGTAVNALTPLGTTPKDTALAESMTATVTSGTTYYIQLEGFGGQDAANILLNWNYVATVYQADIVTFGPGGIIGTVVANAADIGWTVPFGSDLSTLAPTFTLSVGATCTLDGNPAVSGATVDFSGGPKNLIVTSQGATIVNTYTVTATPAPPPTDGTWITDGNGNWSDPANWQASTVADGLDKTAFFTKNITTTTRVVTVDAARTIGNITFTDSTTPSNDLTISGSNALTLDVTTGKPLIDVTQTANRQLSINCMISGSDGLQKNGPGILNLGGTNTYTGMTVLNDGLLNFGASNMDGFGGGPGSRDISVAANKLIQRTAANLNAAFLKRLVETSDELAVCATASGAADVGTGNTLDFSSSTNGANLPNAFFASFATNGGQCRYNGTIIPASDNYRIGYPGTSGALSIIHPLTDISATPRGLIIGGATPVLVADNTFTGDTVLSSGRLFLGRQLALQNSALNVGNGVDGNTGQICFLASSVSGATQGQPTTQPTLGGLIGSRNLLTIYNNANQNNTTRLAATGVLGLTLDVDTGKTHTYSGNVKLATGMYVTKTGPGTQVLSGANDYTGATSVNEGTLGLVGGSHKSPVTVATGASLGFTLGSTTTSTSSVALTNGTVKITGAVDNASDYLLMTATGGFTFTDPLTQLDAPIAAYELQIKGSGTELWLAYTAGTPPYDTWSGGAAANIDSNSDSVSNGVAWVLGAADPNANAIGLLPTSDITTDPSYLIFTFRRSDLAYADTNTAISVEYGSDLTGWTTAADNGVDIFVDEFNDFYGLGTDKVEVAITKSLFPAGKLFARLKVAVTAP
jgi:fibronectin-binding autotransporter adhesin